MIMARSRLRHWVLPALLAGACWTGNVTLFNYWAAGSPPTPHPEIYEQRGDFFFAVTVALLLAAAVFVVMNVRRSRASRSEDWLGAP
jgi:membrane protein DedA with SNARE-associated domain